MSAASTHFVVVRHGETDWNVEGRIQGHIDIPLNSRGEQQAQALQSALAEYSFDAVVSSDLARAHKTAEIATAKHDGVVIGLDSGLRERCFGEGEGRLRSEIAATRASLGATAGAESPAVFAERVTATFERIAEAHAGKTVLVVTHGGALAMLFKHATGIPLDAPRRFSLTNAAINRFSWDSGRWRLEVWNDIAHLKELGWIHL